MKSRKKLINYFNKEIEPYYQAIYRHLLKLGCEENLALDMAQETMEAAWENIYELMDMDYPVNWLYTVAQNNFYSYARRIFNKYEYPDTDLILLDQEHSKYEDDIAEIILAKESSEVVETAFAMIGSKYANLLRMRIFGEYTFEEMAEILNMNPNTVSSAIRRGKYKMALVLTELGYFKEDV